MVGTDLRAFQFHVKNKEKLSLYKAKALVPSTEPAVKTGFHISAPEKSVNTANQWHNIVLGGGGCPLSRHGVASPSQREKEKLLQKTTVSGKTSPRLVATFCIVSTAKSCSISAPLQTGCVERKTIPFPKTIHSEIPWAQWAKQSLKLYQAHSVT